jgi:di/tricarboxylate transporter
LLVALNAQQISIFVILIAAMALLITERLRNDVVAVLIILALYIFSDFVKLGAPLTALSAIVVAVMAPMLWPG